MLWDFLFVLCTISSQFLWIFHFWLSLRCSLTFVTHETKDRVTRTPLITGDELRCSGKVSSSCSTSGTRRGTLVANPVISHELVKDRDVFLWSGRRNTEDWKLSKTIHPHPTPKIWEEKEKKRWIQVCRKICCKLELWIMRASGFTLLEQKTKNGL